MTVCICMQFNYICGVFFYLFDLIDLFLFDNVWQSLHYQPELGQYLLVHLSKSAGKINIMDSFPTKELIISSTVVSSRPGALFMASPVPLSPVKPCTPSSTISFPPLLVPSVSGSYIPAAGSADVPSESERKANISPSAFKPMEKLDSYKGINLSGLSESSARRCSIFVISFVVISFYLFILAMLPSYWRLQLETRRKLTASSALNLRHKLFVYVRWYQAILLRSCCFLPSLRILNLRKILDSAATDCEKFILCEFIFYFYLFLLQKANCITFLIHYNTKLCVTCIFYVGIAPSATLPASANWKNNQLDMPL